MPTPQSFKITMDGWKPSKQSSGDILWINETIPDIMVQRFGLNPPNDLPANYPDIQSHRVMFEAIMSQSQGAVVSVDFLTIKKVEAFQTIFKFRMLDNGLGTRYLGTLMFPFETFFCGFSFQCDEYGTTGMRESMVSLLDTGGKKPQAVSDTPPPVVLNSIDELFDRVKQTPITRFPSDDEKYDQLTPTHPLSRTRQHLKWLAQTLEFDEEVRKAKPYRGVEKRSTNTGLRNIFKRG